MVSSALFTFTSGGICCHLGPFKWGEGWVYQCCVCSLAEEFVGSFGTVQIGKRVGEKMKYHKMCWQCVPRMLTHRDNKECMRQSLNNLLHYKAEGDAFLLHKVASDESWCHHFELCSNMVNMQWKHKKFKCFGWGFSVYILGLFKSQLKLTAFYNHEGFLFVDLKGLVWTSMSYVIYIYVKDTLDKLHKTIKTKWSSIVFMWCGSLAWNAHPHGMNTVHEVLAQKSGKFCKTQTTALTCNHVTFICSDP